MGCDGRWIVGWEEELEGAMRGDGGYIYDGLLI
jgi:hypothetical protein